MKRLAALLLGSVFAFGGVQADVFSNAAEEIDKLTNEVPGIGLILDSIHFDGISISDFQFENGRKHITVQPGQSFSAKMNYKIDADQLSALERHNFVIGLYDNGPQECILHHYGLRDCEGDVDVTLTAPLEKGVYQVRFCHSVDLTEAEAHKAWWRGEGPSAKTIVGIVVVK